VTVDSCALEIFLLTYLRLGRCSRCESDFAAKLQDEKKKKKEEDERKRKEERAKKMAEFDKFKNPTGPNFVISKRGGGGGGGGEVYCAFLM